MNRNIVTGTLFLTMLFFVGLASAAEMVNLNKASAAAIQQNLVGIGPIKAEAIISYRKKNGKFKSLDDLQSVTGIGPALVKKNRRYLSLTKGAVTGDDNAYAATKKQAVRSKSKGVKTTSRVAAKTSRKDAKVKVKSSAQSKKKSGKAKTDKNLTKKAKTKKGSKASETTKKKSKKNTSKKKPSKKKKKASKSTT